MTEYGYVYRDPPVDATAEESFAVCEGNVRESLLWDRWRAENAPTAEALADRATAERDNLMRSVIAPAGLPVWKIGGGMTGPSGNASQVRGLSGSTHPFRIPPLEDSEWGPY